VRFPLSDTASNRRGINGTHWISFDEDLYKNALTRKTTDKRTAFFLLLLLPADRGWVHGIRFGDIGLRLAGLEDVR
jgi:hypothetical protein